MIDFSISLIPVLVITVVNFIISGVVFSPAMPWFNAWARGVGADMNKKEMTEEDKKAMPGLFLGAILSSFLTAYGLQLLVSNLKISDFLSGAILGFLVWAAFVISQSLNSRFEGRKPVVLVINGILYLVTYACFAGILAIWK